MAWMFLSERVSHISLAVTVSWLELRLPDSSVSSTLARAVSDSAADVQKPLIDLFLVCENRALVAAKMMHRESIALMPTLHCSQASAQEQRRCSSTNPDASCSQLSPTA